MAKVAVLMSTYNGDRYVEEQIESIYNQTEKDFELFVRDDGSKIEFVEKLRHLQKKYGFQLYTESNIGFLKSFFSLAERIQEYDYYAFSDQDDIWFKSKLEDALGWFEEQHDSKEPMLYHSAYEIINQDGQVIGKFYFPDEGYDFRRSITENHYSGFSMVINKSAMQLMLKADVDEIDYHDWWLANIVHGMGLAHSDSKVQSYHRAHKNNVTKITFGRRIKWFFDSLNEESDIHKRATQFQILYGKQLSKENQQLLSWFTDEHYNFEHAIKKCFYGKRWRPNIASETVMRLLMLLGKV